MELELVRLGGEQLFEEAHVLLVIFHDQNAEHAARHGRSVARSWRGRPAAAVSDCRSWFFHRGCPRRLTSPAPLFRPKFERKHFGALIFYAAGRSSRCTSMPTMQTSSPKRPVSEKRRTSSSTSPKSSSAG